MMLSATGLESPQPILDPTPFTFSPVQYSLEGAHLTQEYAPTDGGFISANTLSDSQWLFGVVGQDVNVVPRMNWHNDSVTDGQQLLNGFGQLQSNGYSSFDSPALQIAVIETSFHDVVFEPTIKPIVPGPAENPAGPSEGGSIPIHAILADFRNDSHLASGTKVVSSPSTETSLESLTFAHPSSTPDSAIAGEWARAIVFEIAGGEPSVSDPLDKQGATTSSDDETLQQRKPLSSVDTPPQNVELASRHATALPNEGSPVTDANQPQAAQSNEQVAPTINQLLQDAQFAANPSARAALGQISADDTAGAETPNSKAFAAAAVFDQLGEGNAAAIESPASSKSWLQSIGTSPLLMVLALERIAALNSRRATRESRVATAKKSLRLHN